MIRFCLSTLSLEWVSELILQESHWASWICRFRTYYIKFGKFSVLFQIFSFPFLFSETPIIMHTWDPLRVGPRRSPGLRSLFFVLFLHSSRCVVPWSYLWAFTQLLLHWHLLTNFPTTLQSEALLCRFLLRIFSVCTHITWIPLLPRVCFEFFQHI